MLGYDAIPDDWKSGIPALADKKFDYTDFTFHTIVDSTEKRALALIHADRRQRSRRSRDGEDPTAEGAQARGLGRLR